MERLQMIVGRGRSQIGSATDLRFSARTVCSATATELFRTANPTTTATMTTGKEKSDVIELRGGRYVKVHLSNFDAKGHKVFLSWVHNNGLPDSCTLIVPQLVGGEVTLNFKSNCGWIELDTSAAREPHFRVDFEVKLEEMPKTTSPKLLRFTVWEKRKGCLIHLGDAKFHFVLRGTKHNIKSLRAPIVYKQRRHSFCTPVDPLPTCIRDTDSMQNGLPGSDQEQHEEEEHRASIQGMQSHSFPLNMDFHSLKRKSEEQVLCPTPKVRKIECWQPAYEEGESSGSEELFPELLDVF